MAGLFCLMALLPLAAAAAPFAALVMDARSGEVLYSDNADTRLHPASLTKMMTLYIAFEAIERGEISLDTKVTISKKAAAEPPSKLGLKPGQKIALRYLIRAAAIRSANDAATAIGEAISGSEAAFAARMDRTAKALGMTRTTFKNANGLTAAGHLSTARDMTILGRRLFYDYPAYYNIFSRRTDDAGVTQVANTNRRFLDAYKGADGIKTGYTNAAGFNLTASAERGGKRIVATVLGGQSTPHRNQKMAELLDIGFRRAPGSVPVNKPAAPVYADAGKTAPDTRVAAIAAPKTSARPKTRALPAPDPDLLLAMQEEIGAALAQVQDTPQTAPVEAAAPVAAPQQTAIASALPPAEVVPAPPARPQTAVVAALTPQQSPIPPTQHVEEEQEIVTRVSTSGGRHWGVNIGRYPSRYEAERALLQTALAEIGTLDGGLRKVVQKSGGFDANFMGLSRETADLACRRLQTRGMACFTIGP